jgi:hypothetical protein
LNEIMSPLQEDSRQIFQTPLYFSFSPEDLTRQKNNNPENLRAGATRIAAGSLPGGENMRDFAGGLPAGINAKLEC